MTTYFSNTTKGFYPLRKLSAYKEAGTWPEDAAEITDDDYEAFSGTGKVGYTPHRNEDTGVMEWLAIPEEEASANLVRSVAVSDGEQLISVLREIGVLQCSAAVGNPRDGDADRLLELQQQVDRLRDQI